MSSGAQVDLDWARTELAGQNASQILPPPTSRDSGGAKYLTDEEILGLEPLGSSEGDNPTQARRDSSGANRPQNDNPGEAEQSAGGGTAAAQDAQNAQTKVRATEGMPSWMAAVDPRHSVEARELWREHQEFRAAFASPEEARAVKELLPGGVRDVLSLREATQSVERIDAALFSGDSRAQAEVVAELARANHAAFRSLFSEAAKVLGGLGDRQARSFDRSVPNGLTDSPTLRQDREGWGTRKPDVGDTRDDDGRGRRGDDGHERGRHSGGVPGGSAPPPPQNAGDPPPDPDFSGGSAVSVRASGFDPAAYAAFERTTNDAVARAVRGSINDTLTRVMPEGVAEGAARRIGEDIFHEVHRALAADKNLSEQVAAVLRERRFGAAEQQRVSSLLAGRARQLVPSVARRVIGEWTSSVLNTARSKAARQATAASRVDIATPGGSLDSMPLRQMSSRELNYASMSDEEILGM
jgi:hypothetical protein